MCRRLAAPLVVLAALAACSPDDPCAFTVPGARWLAFGSAEAGSWDVQVIRADGSCRRPVTTEPSIDLGPAFGPRGLLFFDSDRAPGLGLWVHDLVGGDTRRLDTGSLRATSPAVSPDGRTIAFEGRVAGEATGAIYTIPLAGGTPTLLTPEAVPHGNGGPCFSPDGGTIYFVSNRTGAYDIYEVPAAGGDVVRVTTGSRIIGKPAVSPDGTRLAYARAVAASSEVVLLELATGAVTPLGVADSSEPAFDPAGGRLVVRVFHGSTATLALAPLDGAAPLALTNGPGPDGAPTFAP